MGTVGTSLIKDIDVQDIISTLVVQRFCNEYHDSDL